MKLLKTLNITNKSNKANNTHTADTSDAVKKTDYNTKINESEKNIFVHNRDKYIIYSRI